MNGNVKLWGPSLLLTTLLCAAPMAVQAQYGPPPGPPPRYSAGQWDAPPQDLQSDYARRGFHDGIIGAQKDFQNHRRPNVNNRDEYRNPKVPPAFRHDYRAGFRRGYDAGVRHLMGGR